MKSLPLDVKPVAMGMIIIEFFFCISQRKFRAFVVISTGNFPSNDTICLINISSLFLPPAGHMIIAGVKQ